jgi:hypothetical protein
MTEQNHKQRNTTIWGIAAQTKKIDTLQNPQKRTDAAVFRCT